MSAKPPGLGTRRRTTSRSRSLRSGHPRVPMVQPTHLRNGDRLGRRSGQSTVPMVRDRSGVRDGRARQLSGGRSLEIQRVLAQIPEVREQREAGDGRRSRATPTWRAWLTSPAPASARS